MPLSHSWHPVLPADFRTSLHHHELTALAEFVTLHIFQCRQLSRAEYLRAVNSARGVIGATGVVLYGSEAEEATA